MGHQCEQSSLVRAIDRAYRVMYERGWDTIYWCIDLHGVCLKSNYVNGKYEWINHEALEGMLEISRQPESRIILWSSAHPEEQTKIVEWMESQGVMIDFFNENPLEKNTQTGCFDKKFYFSVLLDDKAGFEPSADWWRIRDYLKNERYGK